MIFFHAYVYANIGSHADANIHIWRYLGFERRQNILHTYIQVHSNICIWAHRNIQITYMQVPLSRKKTASKHCIYTKIGIFKHKHTRPYRNIQIFLQMNVTDECTWDVDSAKTLYLHKNTIYQGPTLVLIWWFVKLTWLVNLTSYNLSSDLKWGKRAGWHLNLSSRLVKFHMCPKHKCRTLLYIHKNRYIEWDTNMPVQARTYIGACQGIWDVNGAKTVYGRVQDCVVHIYLHMKVPGM